MHKGMGNISLSYFCHWYNVNFNCRPLLLTFSFTFFYFPILKKKLKSLSWIFRSFWHHFAIHYNQANSFCCCFYFVSSAADKGWDAEKLSLTCHPRVLATLQCERVCVYICTHTHIHTHLHIHFSLFLKGIIHLTAGYCVGDDHTVHVLQFSSSDLRNKEHSFQRTASVCSICVHWISKWIRKSSFIYSGKQKVNKNSCSPLVLNISLSLYYNCIASSRSCNVRFV